MSTINQQKLKTCEIITKIEAKITDMEQDRDDLIEELHDRNARDDSDDINDEIFNVCEDIYLYNSIIKKLNKKNHYKCLLNAQRPI